jgi:hypothetical protein
VFTEQGKMLAWVDKFEHALADAHNSAAQRKSALQWMRRVLTYQETQYFTGPSLADIIDDLHRVATGTAVPPRDSSPFGEYPADLFAQVFPGADQPPMPVETLVSVAGVWEPQPRVAMPGMTVIVQAPAEASFQATPMLFLMANIVNCDALADSVVVEWLLPSMGPKADFRPGRKRPVVDIFGSWRRMGTVPLAEAAQAEGFPPIVLPKGSILELIELEPDGKIPFTAFDALRLRHGVDVSGLATSLTHGGNLYRSYVLMNGTAA